jgi:RNA polymerase II subunit A small phosphatase-like protein
MSKHYEIVIYTASLKQYADPLMDILDPERLCTSRLFREHCTLHDMVYVKDMSLLGRHAMNVLLVDNSPNSYKLQPQNAVPIKTWYEDPEDLEL